MPIVATAAWSISKTVADRFPRQGSGLARYAAIFPGVEVNSTFYRRHQPATFSRWASSVPEDFRFAVKMPREITHDRRLKAIDAPFDRLLEDISHLGDRLGPLLCQLPPSLAFRAGVAEPALASMRRKFPGRIVIEPRHRTWASQEARALLEALAIDPVLADPPVIWNRSDFERPARYLRLHGKPEIYYSAYATGEIREFLSLVASDGWCVFDNTASGAATENALEMLDLISA